MDRLVALKFVHPHLVDRPGAADLFRREARAAAQLSHPNIVTAYDAETVGDTHLLVMEFVEGENLADLVQRQGAFPAAQACDYVRQAALGLEHAHQRGMVHRDIKPHNLVLTPQGQVKILDFGLARFLSETGPANVGTDAGVMMGSPDYMAPEQARDAHQADIRADIYALGCTLYHLLAGQVPFPGGSAADKVIAHLHRHPPSLSKTCPDVPVGLGQVVQRMMSKEPGQRYQTPTEVADALLPFCLASSVPTTAPGPRRRIPLRPIALAVFLVMGVLGMRFGAPLLRFATNRGVLAIESEDRDAEVIVRQGGEQVRILDTHTNRQAILKAGEYQLELATKKRGLRLSRNQFTLARGRSESVRVLMDREAPALLPSHGPNTPSRVAFPPTNAPLPLEQWLTGREVLTVALDGTGNFKTIEEALDALKPGQAVRILDKGPYRERLTKDLPENVGLVSEVGTRIELAPWRRGGQPVDNGKTGYFGACLRCPRNLRLSGLELVCPRVETDAGLTNAFCIITDGDFTLDSCRLFQTPRYGLAPPTPDDAPLSMLRVEIVGWTGRQHGRIWVQNNRLECSLFLQSPGAAILIERNHLLGWRWEGIGIWASEPPRDVVIRENIIRGQWGIAFLGREAQADQWVHTPISITNNALEAVSHPIRFVPGDESKRGWYPRKVRVQNNIIRSQKGGGIALSAIALAEVQDSWEVSHNCYMDEPGGILNHRSFPRHSTDLVQQPQYLSLDPTDANFLRIPGDGQLATAGAGGDLPEYIGPFSPGPAPKEPDWFARLRPHGQETCIP